MTGVLKKLVTTIIDKYLKDYIENIDSSQFKLNLVKGKAKLKNLRLKPFAIDHLYPDFPFVISKGTIGELELVVPWHSLKSRSVECIVRNLDIEVIPKDEFNNPQLEEERKHMIKLSSLEKYEIRHKLIEQIRLEVEEEEKRLLEKEEEKEGEGEVDIDSPTSPKSPVDPKKKKKKKKKNKKKKKKNKNKKKKKKKKVAKIPILESLVETIINNIRITIHNVKVRMKYNLNPSRTFVFGMDVKKISIHSTDKDWKVVFLDHIGNLTYKEAALHDFNIFLNTSNDRGRKEGERTYLFEPIKVFSVKVEMQSLSRSIDFDAPLFNVKLELEKEVIRLQLSDEQYKCFLNVFEYFGTFEPKKDEEKEKREELEEKKDVKIRGKYIDLYKKLFLDPPVKKDKSKVANEKEFSSIEKKLHLKTLVLYRDCGRKEMDLQKQLFEERKLQKEKEKEEKKKIKKKMREEEEEEEKKNKEEIEEKEEEESEEEEEEEEKKKKKKKKKGLVGFAGKVFGLGKGKKKKKKSKKKKKKKKKKPKQKKNQKKKKIKKKKKKKSKKEKELQVKVEAEVIGKEVESHREEILRQSAEEVKLKEEFEPSYDELMKIREDMIKKSQKKESLSLKKTQEEKEEEEEVKEVKEMKEEEEEEEYNDDDDEKEDIGETSSFSVEEEQKSFVRFNAEVVLGSLVFTLNKNSVEPLTEVKFGRFQLYVSLKEDGWLARMNMSHFEVIDRAVTSKFPKLIYATQFEEIDDEIKIKKKKKKKKKKEKEDDIKYDDDGKYKLMKVQLDRTLNSLKADVDVRQLTFVVNIEMIRQVLSFFVVDEIPDFQKFVIYKKLKEKKKNKKNKKKKSQFHLSTSSSSLILTGSSSPIPIKSPITEEEEEEEEEESEEESEEEEEGEETTISSSSTEKNLDISILVNIEAPLIYFPVDNMNEDTEYFLLDTGKLSLFRDPVTNPNIDRKHVFKLRDAIICCPRPERRMLTKFDRSELVNEEIILNNFAMDIAVERMKDSNEIAIQFIEHSDIKMIVSPNKASLGIKILETLIQFANNPIYDSFEVGGLFVVDGPIVKKEYGATRMYVEVNRTLKRLIFFDVGEKKNRGRTVIGKVSIANGAVLEDDSSEEENDRFVVMIKKRDGTNQRFLFTSEDKSERDRVFNEIESILKKINEKLEKKKKKKNYKVSLKKKDGGGSGGDNKAKKKKKKKKTKTTTQKKNKGKFIVTLGGTFKSVLVVVNNEIKDVVHLYLKNCEISANNRSTIKGDVWVQSVELYDDIKTRKTIEEELLKDMGSETDSLPEEFLESVIENYDNEKTPTIFCVGIKCSVEKKKGTDLVIGCDLHSLTGKVKMRLVYDCVSMGYDIIDTFDDVKIISRSFKQDSKREEVEVEEGMKKKKKKKIISINMKVGEIQLAVHREKGLKKVTEFEAKKSIIKINTENLFEKVTAKFDFEDLRLSDNINKGTKYHQILEPRKSVEEEGEDQSPSQASLIQIVFGKTKLAPALSFSKSAEVRMCNFRYVHVQKFVKELVLMGIGVLKRVIVREKRRIKNVRVEDLRSFLHIDVKLNEMEVFVPECETEYNGVSAICRELTIINSLTEESKIQVFDITTDSIELHEISPDQERIYTFFDGFSFDLNARICSRSLDPELKYPRVLCGIKIPGLELSLHPSQLRLLIQIFVKNILSGLSSIELVRELEFIQMLKLAKTEILNSVSGVYIPPEFLETIIHLDFEKASFNISDITLKDVVNLELDNLGISLQGWKNNRIIIEMKSSQILGTDIRKESESCFKRFVCTKGVVKVTKTPVLDKIYEVVLDRPDVTLTTSIVSDLARIIRQMRYKEVMMEARKVITDLKSERVEALPEEFFTSSVRNVIVMNKELLILQQMKEKVLQKKRKEKKEEEEEEEGEEEKEEEEEEIIIKKEEKDQKDKKLLLVEEKMSVKKRSERSKTYNVKIIHPKIQVIEDFLKPNSRRLELSTNLVLSGKRALHSVKGSFKVEKVVVGMRYPKNDVFKTILFPLNLEGNLELDKEKSSGMKVFNVGGSLNSPSNKTVSLSYSDLQMGLKVGLRYIQKLREGRQKEQKRRLEEEKEEEEKKSRSIEKSGRRRKRSNTQVKLREKLKERFDTLRRRFREKRNVQKTIIKKVFEDRKKNKTINEESQEEEEEEEEEDSEEIVLGGGEFSGVIFQCDLKSDNLFLELVDDVFGYEIPLFNLNLVELSSIVSLKCEFEKMSELSFSLNNTFNTYINYYNFLKNKYEPVLQRKDHPIRFSISFEKRKGLIEFQSDDVRFNLSQDMMDNVTKTGLTWITHTKRSLKIGGSSEEEDITPKKSNVHVPEFGIVNNTGLKIEIWRPKEGDMVNVGRQKIDFDLALKESKEEEEEDGENERKEVREKEYLDEVIHLCVWDLEGKNKKEESSSNMNTFQVGITEVKTISISLDRLNKNKKKKKKSSKKMKSSSETNEKLLFISVEAIKGQKIVNIHTGHSIKNCTSDNWNLEILSSSAGVSKILGPEEIYHFSYVDLGKDRNLNILSAQDGYGQKGVSNNLHDLLFTNDDTRVTGYCQQRKKKTNKKKSDDEEEGIRSRKYFCLSLEKRDYYEEELNNNNSDRFSSSGGRGSNRLKKLRNRFIRLEIQTPLSITNLLPVDIELSMVCVIKGQNKQRRMKFVLGQGKSQEVYNLDMKLPLLMECSCHFTSTGSKKDLEMWKYHGCAKGANLPVLVSPGGVIDEVKNIGNYFTVKDPSGKELRVKIRYNRSRKYSLEIDVYVDFWIMNRTCVPGLIVQIPPVGKGLTTSLPRTLAGQVLGKEVAQIRHRMILHTSQSSTKKSGHVDELSYEEDMFVSVQGKSSDVFKIDMIKKSESVVVGRYDIGIFTSRAPGRYNRSRIISLTPRYVVVNKTGEEVDICQGCQIEEDKDNDDGIVVASFHDRFFRIKNGKSSPFFREDIDASNSFQFRLVNMTEWCRPYPFENSEGSEETAILLDLLKEQNDSNHDDSDDYSDDEEDEGESEEEDSPIPQLDDAWNSSKLMAIVSPKKGSRRRKKKKKKKQYQPVLIRKLEKEGVVFIELQKTEYPPYSITNLTRMSILIRQKVTKKKNKKNKKNKKILKAIKKNKSSKKGEGGGNTRARRAFKSISAKARSVPFDLTSYDIDSEQVLECVMRQRRYFMQMNKVGREVELDPVSASSYSSEDGERNSAPQRTGYSGISFVPPSTSMSLGVISGARGMSISEANNDHSKRKVFVGVRAEKGTRNIIFSYDKKELRSFSRYYESEEDRIVTSLEEFHGKQKKNPVMLEIKFNVKSVRVALNSRSFSSQQQQQTLLRFSATGLGFHGWVNKHYFWLSSSVKTVRAENEKKDALYRTLLHHRPKKRKKKKMKKKKKKKKKKSSDLLDEYESFVGNDEEEEEEEESEEEEDDERKGGENFLNISLALSHQERQCMYIPYFSLDVQEVVTKLDFLFLEEMSMFVDGFMKIVEEVKDDEFEKNQIINRISTNASPDPVKAPLIMSYLYFDKLLVEPVAVKLTFRLNTISYSSSSSRLKKTINSRSFRISLILDLATTLGSTIEGSKLELKSFDLEHEFLSLGQLVRSVYTHYRGNIMNERLKIVKGLVRGRVKRAGNVVNNLYTVRGIRWLGHRMFGDDKKKKGGEESEEEEEEEEEENEGLKNTKKKAEMMSEEERNLHFHIIGELSDGTMIVVTRDEEELTHFRIQSKEEIFKHKMSEFSKIEWEEKRNTVRLVLNLKKAAKKFSEWRIISNTLAGGVKNRVIECKRSCGEDVQLLKRLSQLYHELKEARSAQMNQKLFK